MFGRAAGGRALASAIKRLIDVVASSTGLALLSPLLATIVAAEIYVHGWPPVFAQKRPGLRNRIFTIYKFRTMTNERDARGVLLPDRARLTPFGSFLRETSLDELPELFNVLVGDMSLVGPRPLLVQYLDRYTPRQMRRHEVKPGLTGWAQIHGRNALSWEEKFDCDVWYVDNWSLWLDLQILARTVFIVLRREGISHADEATMAEFQGTKNAR